MNIVITGTSRGIGLSLAKYYLSLNHSVIGLSRSITNIDNDLFEHIPCDISLEEDINNAIKTIKLKFKTIDVLVNNAGIASMNHIMFTTYQSAQKVIQTNYLSTFLFTREISKLMIRNKFGRIINFTTVAVPLKLDGEAVYASSKAAVETFTKIAAKELASFNITVNAIGPTPIKTNLIASIPENKIQRLLEKQAIPIFGTETDVAHVIDFFISPLSSNITGQIIYLGGVS